MKTLMSFVAVLALAGCYNTFTRENLGDVKKDAVVIWTVDGTHYHLQQWTIDSGGNVNGSGMTCTSKSTSFDHTFENATEFSGTIQNRNIVTVKTASSHTSSGAAVFYVVIAVLIVVLAASSFKVGGIGL